MTLNSSNIHYQIGIPEPLRPEAVELYDEAFGAKFSVAIKDRALRLQLLKESLWMPSAVAAIVDGKLAGLAGFSTIEGSLTMGITARRLIHVLGVVRGAWAIAIFSLYERRPKARELLMDGIVVGSEMRGLGIGTQLLDNLKRYGIEEGYSSIRLDVIDTNNDAKRLYKSIGFVETETTEFGYLRWLLGFGASTTLTYHIGE